MKTYPICDRPLGAPVRLRQSIRAMTTGEFRPPRKGEWYISGAIPGAYRAPNDLDTSYHIAKLVVTEERTETVIVSDYPQKAHD